MHDLQFQSEDAANVVFICLVCGGEIGFNKPGIGTPCPEKIGGEWVAPENSEMWMGPCNE